MHQISRHCKIEVSFLENRKRNLLSSQAKSLANSWSWFSYIRSLSFSLMANYKHEKYGSLGCALIRLLYVLLEIRVTCLAHK